MSVTHTATAFAAFPKSVQEALLAQGHTVEAVVEPTTLETVLPVVSETPALPIGTDAPVVETPVVTSTPDLFAEDLMAIEEPEAEPEKTRIFLNTVIKIGKTEIRVKAAELTSEFHMNNYRDGKVTGENQYMASLVATIEKHGLAAVMEKATIEATLSVSGDGLEAPIDLLA